MARKISQVGRPSPRKKRAPPTTAGERGFPGKEDQQGSWQRGSQGATPLSCWWVGISLRGTLLQNTPVSYSSCRAGLKPPSLPRDTEGSCETLMGGPYHTAWFKKCSECPTGRGIPLQQTPASGPLHSCRPETPGQPGQGNPSHASGSTNWDQVTDHSSTSRPLKSKLI